MGEGEFEPLRAALAAAPYAEGGWLTALERFGAAADARIGQLVNWSAERGAYANLMSGATADQFQAWVDCGGDRPEANPILAAGACRAPLAAFADHEVLPRDARPCHALWQGFYEPADMPHIAAAVLVREHDAHAVLTAVRGRSQGHFTAEDLERISAMAELWRRAVVADRALFGAAAALLRGALEAVTAAAFILDSHGTVRGATRAAEALLAAGALRVSRGRLMAADGDGAARLVAARDACARLGQPQQVTVPTSAEAAIRLTFSTLPAEAAFRLSQPMLVTCERLQPLAVLTAAEGAVARALLRGRSAPEIAAQRRTSLQTVKSQAKAIYAKARVRGQVELILKYGPTGVR